MSDPTSLPDTRPSELDKRIRREVATVIREVAGDDQRWKDHILERVVRTEMKVDAYAQDLQEHRRDDDNRFQQIQIITRDSGVWKNRLIGGFTVIAAAATLVGFGALLYRAAQIIGGASP